MTTALRTTQLSSCRQCAGRPADVLDSVSTTNYNASRAGQQRADQAGDGAHTHITIDGDCLVLRPLTHNSQEVAR
ncbi:hypothetical protein ACFYXH_35910 [Streptomyces sp. NPDC002730]|uniref:hypothetical protein n=1 Tax=Streptomyces sp. NPDC002730 TaxID=3364662 RepID=UPI0036792A00